MIAYSSALFAIFRPMKQSAGLLLYRYKENQLQVLLVHPGGPFWKNKDAGAWSIPKGEFATDEDGLTAAIRETKEETGQLFTGKFVALQPVKQRNGKVVHAWALESDFDTGTLVSNTFLFQWPPRSGKMIEIPEVDRAEWLTPEEAKEKIILAQWNLIEQLLVMLH
jgi:predicted NUDIX family NTP pyrophosphohydrolase